MVSVVAVVAVLQEIMPSTKEKVLPVAVTVVTAMQVEALLLQTLVVVVVDQAEPLLAQITAAMVAPVIAESLIGHRREND